jgi:streptogramin lyase
LDIARRKRLVAVIGALLAFLVVVEIALQVALRTGWSTYRDMDYVSAVAVDEKGQAWVSGFWRERAGLMTYSETGKTVEVPLPGDLGWGGINALMIDRQDRVWLGTEGGRIAMLDINGEWILYSGITEESIWQIVMDGRGQVWARSHRGPAKIDPDSDDRTFSFLNSGMGDSDAVALAIDPQGQLWVLTMKRGLKVLKADGNWRTVVIVPGTVRNGFVDAFLTFDPQGQMWMATVQGIGVLSPNGAWKEHPLGDLYHPLSLYEVMADLEGRVWVAAFQPRYSSAEAFSGLFLFDPQAGWANYSRSNSGLSINAEVMALDPQGQPWIGSSQGRVSTFHPDAALPGNSVSAIRTTARMILPAALLSVTVLAILASVFGSPIQGNERKMIEFSLAFAGWFVIATLLWVSINYAQAQSSSPLIIPPQVLIPPIVNIVLLIVLFVWQRRMAWGALSAFLVNWIGLIFVTPAAYPFGGAPFLASVFMQPFFLPH